MERRKEREEPSGEQSQCASNKLPSFAVAGRKGSPIPDVPRVLTALCSPPYLFYPRVYTGGDVEVTIWGSLRRLTCCWVGVVSQEPVPACGGDTLHPSVHPTSQPCSRLYYSSGLLLLYPFSFFF